MNGWNATAAGINSGYRYKSAGTGCNPLGGRKNATAITLAAVRVARRILKG